MHRFHFFAVVIFAGSFVGGLNAMNKQPGLLERFDTKSLKKWVSDQENHQRRLEEVVARKEKDEAVDLDTPLEGMSYVPLLEMANDVSCSSLLERLLEAGADPNSATTPGDKETALHLVAQRRDVHIVRVLLQAGANPNAEDGTASKDTPLVYAIVGDYPNNDTGPRPELVQVLLEHKADPNKQNAFGATALVKAVRMLSRVGFEKAEKYKEIIRLLVKHGADPRIKVSKGLYAGKNAIDIARENNLPNVAQFLEDVKDHAEDMKARL